MSRELTTADLQKLLAICVDRLNDAIVITEAEPINDPGPRIVWANKVFYERNGYSPEEVIGQSPRLLQGVNTDRATLDKVRVALEKWQPIRAETLNYRKDGTTYWNEFEIVPVANDKGWFTHWVSVQRDVTQRKMDEMAQQKTHQEMLSLLDSMAEGAFGTDINGYCTFVNRSFLRILGYSSQEEVVGQHIHELIHHSRADGAHHPSSECHLHNVSLAKQDANQADEVLWNKNGHAVPVEFWSSPLVIDGVAKGAVTTFVDVTERQQAEKIIKQLAFFDPLTQLPNRRLFSDRLDQAIAASERNGTHCALMMLDLDNFKSINDHHGHLAGDLLLKEATKRLLSCVREIDTVARFGGDEFLVLLKELSTNEVEANAQTTMVAEKIRVSLSAPYELDISSLTKKPTTLEHRSSASIGLIVFKGKKTNQNELLQWADTAMYKAKEAGRNQIWVHGLSEE